MNKQNGKDTIQLPTELFSRIKNRVDTTEFSDPNEYVIFVLKEILHQTKQENSYSSEPVEEQQVQDRLKSLGYLNE